MHVFARAGHPPPCTVSPRTYEIQLPGSRRTCTFYSVGFLVRPTFPEFPKKRVPMLPLVSAGTLAFTTLTTLNASSLLAQGFFSLVIDVRRLDEYESTNWTSPEHPPGHLAGACRRRIVRTHCSLIAHNPLTATFPSHCE